MFLMKIAGIQDEIRVAGGLTNGAVQMHWSPVWGISHSSARSTLKAAQSGEWYPHFTDEETEAQRDSGICLRTQPFSLGSGI